LLDYLQLLAVLASLTDTYGHSVSQFEEDFLNLTTTPGLDNGAAKERGTAVFRLPIAILWEFFFVRCGLMSSSSLPKMLTFDSANRLLATAIKSVSSPLR
jgi:hypothetical protein